ncbi:vegetative cell wall protein gp1-like [Choloepus didactylus]|uniref:vegetative cell wall protein gp1-like n=1 Tax=Choloepus didactylus TaxID=27675 RepID=UPI00189DB727|nr:vegetative cell wall protein gp1-like [Choloepus didactylus]
MRDRICANKGAGAGAGPGVQGGRQPLLPAKAREATTGRPQRGSLHPTRFPCQVGRLGPTRSGWVGPARGPSPAPVERPFLKNADSSGKTRRPSPRPSPVHRRERPRGPPGKCQGSRTALGSHGVLGPCIGPSLPRGPPTFLTRAPQLEALAPPGAQLPARFLAKASRQVPRGGDSTRTGGRGAIRGANLILPVQTWAAALTPAGKDVVGREGQRGAVASPALPPRPPPHVGISWFRLPLPLDPTPHATPHLPSAWVRPNPVSLSPGCPACGCGPAHHPAPSPWPTAPHPARYPATGRSAPSSPIRTWPSTQPPAHRPAPGPAPTASPPLSTQPTTPHPAQYPALSPPLSTQPITPHPAPSLPPHTQPSTQPPPHHSAPSPQPTTPHPAQHLLPAHHSAPSPQPTTPHPAQHPAPSSPLSTQPPAHHPTPGPAPAASPPLSTQPTTLHPAQHPAPSPPLSTQHPAHHTTPGPAPAASPPLSTQPTTPHPAQHPAPSPPLSTQHPAHHTTPGPAPAASLAMNDGGLKVCPPPTLLKLL